MSKQAPFYSRVNGNQSGFYVWRIENMQVVPVAKEFYGEFYRGDSYIILSISKDQSRLESHVHFWLGSETSQDEAGVAAYKSVELDDFLGGAPVQHREVEGHESRRFLSYFPSGIKIKEGGVKSGFHHVEKKTFQPRLIHVKGRRNPRFSECRSLSWDQMNHGDCYILDLGQMIFMWNGSQANRKEKIKTAEHCRKLREERGSKANIIFLDDGQEAGQLDKELKSIFEKYLPLGDKNKVQDVSEVAADEAEENKQASNIKLYSCKEEGGTLRIQEVKAGPLSKKDLITDLEKNESEDSFIIDNNPSGAWIWIGKKASKMERKEAMRNAVGFLKKKGYTSNSNVTRVVEGAEPVDFKCLFKDWPQPAPSGKVYTRSRIAKTVQTKFDAATLHNNTALAAETQMVDDGTGKVDVWRVENFELVPLERHHIGEFYGGDCYVVLYTYTGDNRRECHIIYYWLGLKSTADEQGTAALKTVEMDTKMGGGPVQIRVVQYKEPPHFMAIFGGKMIIFEGGKSGWQKSSTGFRDTETGENGPGDKYMLQVRGTSPLDTKAIQVPIRAASLNSNDVFVVFTKNAVYSWAGKGCTGDEREMAKNIAARSPRALTTVFEGQEKADFWEILGGKEEYASTKVLKEEGSHPPRLFQLSNAAGTVRVEEIHDFVQSDLIEDDIMILDAWESIYIWQGDGSNKIEREASEKCALDYLKTDPAGRDPNTPIIKIKQGFEPPSFTGFFGTWDRDLWSKGLTFEELKKQIGEGNLPIEKVKENVSNGIQDFHEVPKYSLVELQVSVEDLPAGVDHSAREIHLKDEEFSALFKMSYAEFNQLPMWKQAQFKKANKLF